MPASSSLSPAPSIPPIRRSPRLQAKAARGTEEAENEVKHAVRAAEASASPSNSHADYSFRRNVASISPFGWLLLLVIVTLWLLYATLEDKILAFQGAFVYSYLEFSWYTFTREIDGRVQVIPLSEKGRTGFTSVEQFLGNVLYLPLAFRGYHALLPLPSDPSSSLFLCVIGARIILFPFNIWCLEVVMDTVLKAMMGRNPAWDYTGDEGSRLGGAINILHWRLWIFLGVLAETLPVSIAICVIIVGCTVVHVTKRIVRKA